MKIAIDITPLGPGHKDRGVGAYTKLLIEALEKYEKSHSYYYFTRGQKVPDDVELIHYPYFDPYFVTLPFFHDKPTVVTVHDFIPLVFPEHFPAGIRGAIKWQYQKIMLNGARRVIADSEASKRDIGRIAGIPSSRIDVVHLAPSPKFGKIADGAALEKVKKQYRLPERFILYVGDVNWNKNVPGLMKAFRNIQYPISNIQLKARKSKSNDLKLILVGKAFLDNELKESQEINRLIESYSLGANVLKLGGIPFEDLIVIYNLASVYIQPSFYEGFGLPVLEAMVCGTPVVTSRVSSLAEIAGPSITIDPGDPMDIVRGLLVALTMTSAKRQALINAQSKWVQGFSWECVAHNTVETYEKALR